MGYISSAFDLSDRVAVVTGAARGIGLSAATLLAEAGAHVVLADLLDDVARDEAAKLESAEAVRLDVSDKAANFALADDLVARHGRIDVWVNNAAIIVDIPMLDISEEEFDRVHAVNFKGVLWGCQAAGRAMKASGRGGSIINIASGSIDLGAPNVGAYSIAKAGAHQLTRTLAVENGRDHIRVNSIAPGWIDTAINLRHHLKADGTVDEEKKAAYVKMRAESAALGIAGEPNDIGFAILYLASDAAKFVSGQCLRPNGGTTMPW